MAANNTPSNSGVGIQRNSLTTNLASRYKNWKNDFERLAPKAVDFFDNSWAKGFTKNMQASDIRNITKGEFVYGNERRIPQKVSDSIKTTYGAGAANEIQDEFKAYPIPRVTRFQSKGLNYLDTIPGFSNTKYYTGGLDPRANLKTTR